jgi:glycosyltransferase involved in cell wall biosynthesis
MGRGFVFDHHDLVPESVSERWHGLYGAFVRLIAVVAERLTYKTAHVAITTNQSYRDIGVKRGRKAPHNIVVVRNGPEMSLLPAAKPKLDFRNGRRYLVGYLGIMGPQDGLEVLIEAVRIIVREKKRDDIQFRFVGDGPLRPVLQRRCQEWDLLTYVDLPGLAVSMEEWANALAYPDVCVSPELPTPFNSHSTITKLAEYMAFGRPVVCFDLHETRVTVGDAALIVKEPGAASLAEGILSLLDDERTRARLSRDARCRAEMHLSWEAQEASLHLAYDMAFSFVRHPVTNK